MDVECPLELSPEDVEYVILALWDYAENSEMGSITTSTIALGKTVSEGIIVVELSMTSGSKGDKSCETRCRIYGLATDNELASFISELRLLAAAWREYLAKRRGFKEGRGGLYDVNASRRKAIDAARRGLAQSRRAARRLALLDVHDRLTWLLNKYTGEPYG